MNKSPDILGPQVFYHKMERISSSLLITGLTDTMHIFLNY